MESLKYLLPLLLGLPLIVNYAATRNPSLRLNKAQLIFPLSFLILSLLSFASGFPIELTFWDFSNYFSLGLKLDILSGLILTTVSTIGIIVSRYTHRYLEDDPKKNEFFKNLTLTKTFVLTMLMAPNLVLLFVAWIGTSFYLHKLLTHFSKRSGAINAADQKFWVSRFGDIFIISAGAVLFKVFNTLEFSTIFEVLRTPSFTQDNSLLLNISSVLLVLGAMTKSALFPFHYWLPNTMETPTPVSAIMHAGIINAGGYLVVRMSPLLTQTSLALSLLAVIGGFTAFWATVAMFTQNNIKKNLAYSTIAQMGFMMLQCGLGAFSIAVVHIIGHAFYKAYAFLSSGTATDFGRLNRYFPKKKVQRSIWDPFIYGSLSMITILGCASYSGMKLAENPGVTVLLIILSLAVAQILMSSTDKVKSLILAFSVVLCYAGLSQIMGKLLKTTVAQGINTVDLTTALTTIACASFFVALYLIQNSLEKLSQTRIGKIMYVKALKGSF